MKVKIAMIVLSLTSLCLDFDTGHDKYRSAFERFLQKHHETLGLTDTVNAAEEYLDRVYPDGVPGSATISNIALNGNNLWLLRPPTEGPLASSFAAGSYAPAFRVRMSGHRDTLSVCGFEVVPHIAARSYESVISCSIHRQPTGQRMQPTDLSAISELPAHRRETNDRLAPWTECIEWRKKLAHEARLAVAYDHVSRHSGGVARFSVRTALAEGDLRRRLGAGAVLAVPSAASTNPDRWEPARGARTTKLRLGQVLDIHVKRQAGNGNRKIGLAELVIDLDDNDFAELSDTGFIMTTVGGKLRPLENELRGIKRLREDRGHSPYLSSWLFDMTKAATPAAVPDLCSSDPALSHLNLDQVAAVNKALAAPDVLAIQGPPGTGKTTVIAAICRLEVARGSRVLVASQTNLAVDNALDRNGGQIDVRPLRIGKEERVNERSRELLSNRAAKRWLNMVGYKSQKRLAKQADRRRAVRQAEQSFGTLRRNLEQIEAGRIQVVEIEQNIEGLQSQQEGVSRDLHSAGAERESRHREIRVIQELVDWTNHPTSAPPNVHLMTNEMVTKSLAEVLTRMRRSLPRSNWALPWNTEYRRSAVAVIDAIHEIASALDVAPHLSETVSTILELCSRSSSLSTTGNQELSQLQTEKRSLIDGESDEDMFRLAAINRQIKTLQGDQWSGLTRELKGQLEHLFVEPLPDDLVTLVSSLGPHADLQGTVHELAVLTEQITENGLQRFQQELDWLRTALAETLTAMESAHACTASRFDELNRRNTETEIALETARSSLKEEKRQILNLEDRWEELWPTVCPDLDTTDAAVLPANGENLEARLRAIERWRRDNGPQWQQESAMQPILEEWVKRLADPDAGRNQEIQSLYNGNANVVGMTCNESANPDQWDDPQFSPYDVVIIDEVSKATPTELLLPMLLGRKIILVGDHRQLPPMLYENEQSFAEAIEAGNVDPTDFRRFEQMVTASFFQELFDAAPDSLRHSLTTQYRMHSQIMTAVNEFYDRQLVSGERENELDRQRQHRLTIRDGKGGLFLTPKNHLLWIDSSLDHRNQPVEEQTRGTSKINLLEVDLILATLQQLQSALRARGYGFIAKVTASAREAGLMTSEWAQQVHPRAKDATLTEGFSSGTIRLNGSSIGPTRTVRAGDVMSLDLRKSVGVITFYGAQLQELRRRINNATQRDPYAFSTMDLQCNTVDRFQGMERAIVLVSLVRTRKQLGKRSFVNQFERINVAFSRARELLMIVGTERTFRDAVIELPGMSSGTTRRVRAYKNIFDLVRRFGGRRYAGQLIG